MEHPHNETTQTTGRIVAVALAIALAAAGCGDGGDDAAGSTTSSDTSSETSAAPEAAPSAAGDTNSTLDAVESGQWSDTIAITVDGDSFRFESNGLPDHELPDAFLVPTSGQFSPPVTEDETAVVATEIAVVESPVDQTITLNPVYSDTTTETNLGIIGVMISGAQLFNDYEDMDRQFVAVDDSFSVGGVGFTDSCNGHPLALLADGTGNGNYHYHGVPYCITDDVDVDGEHSTMIGILRDGFPVYGNKDEGGETITNADLDECSGHVGPTPEFPDGIYHYHLTDDAAPYTIDCYHGVIDDGDAAAAGGAGAGGAPEGDAPEGAAPQGGAPDFTDAAQALGVSVEELEGALGQPPFDLEAAAAELGVSAADLEAVLPAPPGS